MGDTLYFSTPRIRMYFFFVTVKIGFKTQQSITTIALTVNGSTLTFSGVGGFTGGGGSLDLHISDFPTSLAVKK